MVEWSNGIAFVSLLVAVVAAAIALYGRFQYERRIDAIFLGERCRIGSGRRLQLNQSTHSSVAYSTVSRLSHGLLRPMTSVLKRPMKLSAIALSVGLPGRAKSDRTPPSSAQRCIVRLMPRGDLPRGTRAVAGMSRYCGFHAVVLLALAVEARRLHAVDASPRRAPRPRPPSGC